MTDNNNSNSGNTFSAAAMGAMVGVIAGVAAVFLIDEKKRNEVLGKAQKVFKNINDRVTDTAEDIEGKLDESKEMLAEKLEKTARRVKN